MLIFIILLLIFIILTFGNPFGKLSKENKGAWNNMGIIFSVTLLILFVGITIRHM